MSAPDPKGIAIIGMTGRFPGAPDVEQFWRNIAGGVESISKFTDDELAASGVDVAEAKSTPGFVPARGVLADADLFDPGFFGMSGTEASVIDPQQRLFLEASWQLLESAGYDPEAYAGLIGVYAGMGSNGYYLHYLHGRKDITRLVGDRVISLGNDKDFLATRVAYKLNLKGPALNINTACSTSLVTVCQACQELMSFQCDVALAGGVSITFPQKGGVYYQEGGVFSPDGHCRPFDAQAQGTVSSDGLGIVLLKRLSEAIEDGDQIHAVIRGFGRNNDGSSKVGFTAPSVDGQSEAILTAQSMAGFDPATITYLEAHGTATPLGDPIEIAALTQAFRFETEAKNFCAIGSVKGNIGHTNTAAGIAGLLKTVQALRHRQLPPTIHFSSPNPKIDFADSPFFVSTKLADWKSAGPRRAGVSSFGLGGTNAHVVLEEAPNLEPSAPARGEQLLVLSAKNPAALDTATTQLLSHFKENPSLNLADAAHTLQVGRRHFAHRRALVCRDVDDAIKTLEARDAKRVFTYERDLDAEAPAVVFMFPGQGSQYVGMGADLYRGQAVFKEEMDRCAEILKPALDGLDLREILYPAADKAKEAEELLIQTRITQPALFAIEYALAKLWMSWGVQPAALTGHSLGEYVAACLAGVFSLEDALSLVAQRGKLIQSLPRGSMMAVSMPEAELQKILPPNLSIAGVNGPIQCVVSGPTEDITAFEATLKTAGKPGRPLHTSHAFHSAMMDPVVASFAECVRRTKRGEPTIPFLSNLTGKWITPSEATDPQYWARHLRQAVRFADGVKELLKNPNAVFLEVGPGTTLGSLTKFQANKADNRAILSSLRHAKDEQPDLAAMLSGLGQLWMRGVTVDWAAVHGGVKRRRVILPGHPLKRERYWIERAAQVVSAPAPTAVVATSAPIKTTPQTKVASSVSVPLGGIEQGIAEIWQQLLGLKSVGVDDNFFDLGGDSLLLMRVHLLVQEKFHAQLAIAEMFEYPTITSLAKRLGQGGAAVVAAPKSTAAPCVCDAVADESQPRAAVVDAVPARIRADSHAIAIIGMSGRFPGANSVDELWRNLVGEVDSTSFFTDEELAASGLDVAELRANKNYVPARGIIDRPEWFDAGFFGIGAKEAQILDPQQRVFMEHSWEALEHAGYDSSRYGGHIGVFAGMGGNSYFLNNLQAHPELIEQVGRIPIFMGNDKDFLATRTAYKLNLKGPAISTGTACSTSLVAVALACQSLTSQQSDMALAGGVAIRFPQKHGNLYQDGSVFSKDGKCRPFDAEASGTFFSDGVGIVVLKRLEDAMRDGDQVYAVIKGVGLNNDGADKVGYTAPSIAGQAEAICRAHADAGINAESISYVEAHGTATALGDPIEISALTQAFRTGTDRKGYCAIGSIKGNFGHCDSAAGVIGLIKTSLAMRNRQLPASIHFSAPNPRIDFANSPFFVNTKLTEWRGGSTPRRAGISSFGIGGTNVHVVIEEAPALRPTTASRGWQLLIFSARSAAALDAATSRFVAHLKANPDIDLADAAYTLQVGRRAFPHRRMVVCRDVADAIRALETLDPKRVVTKQTDAKDCPVVFMFPGQGTPAQNMGADLYRTEPVFRAEVDRCADIVTAKVGQDIRPMLFPSANMFEQAEAQLSELALTQTALFIVEYALARVWISWGISPQAMISHSMGEFVAACVAGVFSAEEAINAIVSRSRLIQQQPLGAMIAVRLPESDLVALLPGELSIAALNSPALSVVAGPCDAAQEFETSLESRGVTIRRLENTHALHSAMMEPVVGPLTEVLEKIHFEKPAIPYVSNVTGNWVSPDEATNPRYWARQVSQTVRFADGLDEVLKDPQRVLLEVGPGRSLTTFASQHPAKTPDRLVIASLPSSPDGDIASMLDGLGRLWLAGKQVDWAGFYGHESRRRIPLPTYPFQRERYWIERGAPLPSIAPAKTSTPAPAVEAEKHARPEMASALAIPESEVESKLVEIWQEVFGLSEVGVDDSFFDLGGDSLLAVPLITKINSALGCDLQIPVFFENPTIRKLAPALGQLSSEESAAQPSTGLGDANGPFIITFQKKGSRPPFFFLHGDWAGGGFYCGRILEKLGSDQPFYALPPYRTGKTERFPFEEMVDKYYKAIRAHTPRGPYILGGYCIGGMLALEVARRLIEEGEQVLHLFQIDVPWRSTTQARLLWGGVDLVGNVLKWDLVKKIKNYDRYPLGVVRWLKMPLRNKVLAIGRRLKLTTAGSTDPTLLGVRGGATFEIFDGPDYNIYILASILHAIKPFNLPTSVYIAEEGPSIESRKRNAHGILLNGTFEPIPGNHTTCITRHANVPAEKIAQALNAMFPESRNQAPQQAAPDLATAGRNS
jgi:acyl transferase domain-containing protein/pimeloyl-ACP methyl ester carboxylesterase